MQKNVTQPLNILPPNRIVMIATNATEQNGATTGAQVEKSVYAERRAKVESGESQIEITNAGEGLPVLDELVGAFHGLKVQATANIRKNGVGVDEITVYLACIDNADNRKIKRVIQKHGFKVKHIVMVASYFGSLKEDSAIAIKFKVREPRA